MNHIDYLEQILEEITGYTIVQQVNETVDIEFYLTPADIPSKGHLEAAEYYNLVIRTDTLDKMHTYKKALLRIKTILDFDYNDFDERGYIETSDGTDFSVTDAIVGAVSGATGTVYKIVDDRLYLKDITGVWQVEAITAKTATCTSTETEILFPFFLDVELISIYYPVEYNEDVGAVFAVRLRYEAVWTL